MYELKNNLIFCYWLPRRRQGCNRPLWEAFVWHIRELHSFHRDCRRIQGLSRYSRILKLNKLPWRWTQFLDPLILWLQHHFDGIDSPPKHSRLFATLPLGFNINNDKEFTQLINSIRIISNFLLQHSSSIQRIHRELEHRYQYYEECCRSQCSISIFEFRNTAPALGSSTLIIKVNDYLWIIMRRKE